jgi:hypothetical protein
MSREGMLNVVKLNVSRVQQILAKADAVSECIQAEIARRECSN